MRRRWKAWSLRRRVVVSIALAFLLLVLTPLVSVRLQYTGSPSAEARTRNHDALWLGHAWVDGRKTAADVTALARQLDGRLEISGQPGTRVEIRMPLPEAG